MVSRNINVDEDLDQRMRTKIFTKGYIKGDYAAFVNMAIDLYLERLDSQELVATPDECAMVDAEGEVS